jgi:deoxyribonuclease V
LCEAPPGPFRQIGPVPSSPDPGQDPNISTYLSFREIPILLDLLDAVRAAGRIAEVLLVDGTGILHHRHAGIASHLGVVASLLTIGITKKLLCGQVDVKEMTPSESRPVVYEDQLTGVALRPIFISPGHRVDVAFCEQLVRRLLTGRRLPEPIYWADRWKGTVHFRRTKIGTVPQLFIRRS